jgi:hypothetical protein
MRVQGKIKAIGKICPITTLFTNTTCTGLESNSGLNVERPATNRLGYGTFLKAEIDT